jgi:hypothetical protein
MRVAISDTSPPPTPPVLLQSTVTASLNNQLKKICSVSYYDSSVLFSFSMRCLSYRLPANIAKEIRIDDLPTSKCTRTYQTGDLFVGLV